ncbi:hypothetical protein H7X65_01525 [Candidatus Parcubacteria bacterium]|nr:hypothetical protein [Candidatus Parcubacteria bacterium]
MKTHLSRTLSVILILLMVAYRQHHMLLGTLHVSAGIAGFLMYIYKNPNFPNWDDLKIGIVITSVICGILALLSYSFIEWEGHDETIRGCEDSDI